MQLLSICFLIVSNALLRCSDKSSLFLRIVLRHTDYLLDTICIFQVITFFFLAATLVLCLVVKYKKALAVIVYIAYLTGLSNLCIKYGHTFDVLYSSSGLVLIVTFISSTITLRVILYNFRIHVKGTTTFLDLIFYLPETVSSKYNNLIKLISVFIHRLSCGISLSNYPAICSWVLTLVITRFLRYEFLMSPFIYHLDSPLYVLTVMSLVIPLFFFYRENIS